MGGSRRVSILNWQYMIVQGFGQGFKYLFDACKFSNFAPFSRVVKILLNITVTCLKKKISEFSTKPIREVDLEALGGGECSMEGSDSRAI